MADPIWVDGTTPLNSANMTQLQTRDEKNAPSGYVGLNATSQIVFQGDASANLYRESAAVIKTDGNFVAAGQVHSNRNTAQAVILTASGVQPCIYFGNALDTNLYRPAAGDLKTDGRFLSVKDIFAQANGSYAGIGALGPSGQPALTLTADTSLYRQSTNQLRTPGQLDVGASLWLYGSSPILFGSAADTNLYRSSATRLKTDSNFVCSGYLFVGTAEDAYIYHSAAGQLTLGGEFFVNGRAMVNMGSAATAQVWVGQYGGSIPFAGLTFGGDTYLWRQAANALQTDGGFIVKGATSLCSTVYINDSTGIDGNTPYFYKSAALALTTNAQISASGFVDANSGSANRVVIGYRTGVGNAPGITFGSGLDTTLYRYGANVLATPGFLRVDGSAANGGSSSGLLITFGIYGARWVDVGVPDSGGTGYRAVIVSN